MTREIRIRKYPPYVHAYKDRHGKMRYYVRLPGRPNVALPGKPATKRFQHAYEKAFAPPKPPNPPKPLPTAPERVKLRRPTTGYVYYLSDGDHVKIGFTIDWERRIKGYQTHNPRQLKLLALHPALRSYEKTLHRKFKQFRVKGTEWFRPEQPLLDHIVGTIDELALATQLPERGLTLEQTS